MRALTKLGIAVDPLGFNNECYSGTTRKELERTNRALWNYLRENDLLMSSKRRNYGKNPVEFYNKRYNGVTRGRLPYVDSSLYLALRYHKQLHLVPAKKDLLKK